MTQQTVDLSNFMEDAQGRLVPIELVKEIDKTRDALVRKTIEKGMIVQKAIIDFKQTSMQEVQAFVELSAMEWDVKFGGKKGNITLYSFDGRYKIQVRICEHMVFDEQLQVAKRMIDQCLTKWTRESNSEIKAIINDAFQVDKEGRINTQRILSLRRLDIKDSLWKKAMDAITASLQVVGSKEYFRLYMRNKGLDKWSPVSLDMAAL